MPEEQSGDVGAQVPRVPTVRDMDIVYQEVQRLYYEISKGCGLSETAYWILVDIVAARRGQSQRATRSRVRR